MEVVCAGEADLLRDLVDRGVRGHKKLQGVVDTNAVDIVDGRFADAVLKHLREIVRGDGDHLGESIDIYLLAVMLLNVADNGS